MHCQAIAAPTPSALHITDIAEELRHEQAPRKFRPQEFFPPPLGLLRYALKTCLESIVYYIVFGDRYSTLRDTAHFSL